MGDETDSSVDWSQIQRLIPGSSDANSPVQRIRCSLEANTGPDRYEKVQAELNQLAADLQKRFQELSGV